MIECHSIADHASYCWLDLRCAESTAYIQTLVRPADTAAVETIGNDSRRNASLIGRGLLYHLAKHMLGADRYTINKTVSGRPLLQDTSGNHVAFASISHSHGRVAAALHRRYPIGIDVEYHQPDRDFHRVAQRIFPPVIADKISSMEGFYQAWCLYEAWGKANDLEHIDPDRNTPLMQLLEEWLCNPTAAVLPDNRAVFFMPGANYAGCVYSEEPGQARAASAVR